VEEQKTVIITVDDLQWADQQSIAVLVEAVEIEGLLLVMGVRSNAAHGDALASLMSLKEVGLQPLAPLDGVAYSGFLQEVIDATSLDEDVVTEVRKRAGDNLSVASIIVRGLKDRGSLKVDEKGHCSVSGDVDLGEEGAQEGGEIEEAAGLIASRFAQLGRREQDLLHTASVFGPIAPVAMLARVHVSLFGGTEVELLETAQSLFRHKFLRRDKKRGDEVEFDSLVVQQAVYAQMLVSQRELIHTRIVDEMEMDDDHRKKDYGVLISHCKRSGDLGRTRKYLMLAGLHSRRLGLSKGVRHFFTELEEFDEKHGSRFWKASESDFLSHAHESGAMKLYAGRAEYTLGHFQDSKVKIGEGLKQLGMSLPSSDFGSVLSLGSWAVSDIALGMKPKVNPARWEKMFGTGPTTIRLVKDISAAFGDLASSYILTNGPVTKFLHAVTQMYKIACSIDDHESICTACAWVTTAFAISGLTNLADSYSKQATSLADVSPTTACVAAASYSRTWVYGNLGKRKEAYYDSAKAAEAFMEVGDMRRANESNGTKEWVGERSGCASEAGARAKRVRERSWRASEAGARAKLARERSWRASEAGARAKLARERSWRASEAGARAKRARERSGRVSEVGAASTERLHARA
jgi:hypothetical protein